MNSATPAPALKEMFDEARYRGLARSLARLEPTFKRKTFLDLALDGLDARSLTQRLRRTSEAVNAALPLNFPGCVALLRKLAPQIDHPFVGVFLSDFVALYGRKHYKLSLEALAEFTQYGSAEFAIRTFLEDDLAETLKVMLAWSRHSSEHVRRLASEGSRPRLPWARQLSEIRRDPELAAPILERLVADPSRYVRTSVANHLNDVSKDHPDWLVAWCSRQEQADPRIAWVVRKALRTLIKQGHPGALAVIGVSGPAKVKTVSFKISPPRLRLGERLALEAALASDSDSPQALVLDYAIHYVRAGGGAARKVFKWKACTLVPGARLVLGKNQRIQDFTTRKHHPGRHRVDLLLNGRMVAQAAFVLAMS